MINKIVFPLLSIILAYKLYLLTLIILINILIIILIWTNLIYYIIKILLIQKYI